MTFYKRWNLHRSDRKCRQFNRFQLREHSFENTVFCCIEANDTWTDGQPCGYKSKYVDKAITKASSIHKHELLKYKSNTIHNTCCSNEPPWSPKNYKTSLTSTGKSLKQTQSSTLFSLMIAFRLPKSLKDILVRAKVKSRQDSPKNESRPCNVSRCQSCRLIPFVQTFKSKSGAISTIKGCHTYKPSNAVLWSI